MLGARDPSMAGTLPETRPNRGFGTSEFGNGSSDRRLLLCNFLPEFIQESSPRRKDTAGPPVLQIRSHSLQFLCWRSVGEPSGNHPQPLKGQHLKPKLQLSFCSPAAARWAPAAIAARIQALQTLFCPTPERVLGLICPPPAKAVST